MKIGTVRKLAKDDNDGNARGQLSDLIASRSFLISVASFLGAGGLWLAEPHKGSVVAALQPYAPAAMSLAGSFLAGLIIGRIARRKLKHVLIVGGVMVIAVSLLTRFGVIGPAADHWVQSSVGWASDRLDRAHGYIATLLPSATAAGSGLYLGFRRKRKLRRAEGRV